MTQVAVCVVGIDDPFYFADADLRWRTEAGGALVILTIHVKATGALLAHFPADKVTAVYMTDADCCRPSPEPAP